MRFRSILALCICVMAFTISLRAQDGFDTFWQKFKTSVIKGDKETVASLSRFPLVVSTEKRKLSIKNKLSFASDTAIFLVNALI